MSSCGVVRFRNAPTYHAGQAQKEGYAHQGIIEEVYYDCSVPGPTRRRMLVYLPRDYYENRQRYPVFYLLHGARGYETSWVRKGFVYETTDSLFRNGLATPCIVVMPNMNQYNNDRDFDNSRFKDAFESIFEVNGVVETAFMQDVVGAIDSLYRTIPDKAHRAIAGLSIGGWQSMWIALNNPDSFDYIGAFSPYCWGMSLPSSYRRRFYSGMYRKLKVQFQDPPKGYYLYAGKKDIMRPSTIRYHQILEQRNYRHDYFLYPGGHDWPEGWIEEYQDMLQRVFKSQKP